MLFFYQISRFDLFFFSVTPSACTLLHFPWWSHSYLLWCSGFFFFFLILTSKTDHPKCSSFRHVSSVELIKHILCCVDANACLLYMKQNLFLNTQLPKINFKLTLLCLYLVCIYIVKGLDNLLSSARDAACTTYTQEVCS